MFTQLREMLHWLNRELKKLLVPALKSEASRTFPSAPLSSLWHSLMSWSMYVSLSRSTKNSRSFWSTVAIGLKWTTSVHKDRRLYRLKRQDIELATHKLYFSRHDRVMTDANHKNNSLFIVSGGALRLEDFRFAILTLLASWLWEDAFFLFRPPPRNFLIIFCGVRMSRVCLGLAPISDMIFPPVRIASRPRNLAPLHSTGRTVYHSKWRKLPTPCPRCTNGEKE
jgi:hypothetical protein